VTKLEEMTGSHEQDASLTDAIGKAALLAHLKPTLEDLLRDRDLTVARCGKPVRYEHDYYVGTEPCRRAEGHGDNRCTSFKTPVLSRAEIGDLLDQVLERVRAEHPA